MTSRCFWMTVAIQLAFVAQLRAQPWVPPRGEGTVSFTYQNYYVLGHFDVQGHENTNGATHAKSMIADVDFGVTDTIGLTVSLPFIATRYTGPHEYFVGGIPTHPGPLDNGTYHGTFQDLRVEVRRAWWAGPVTVAPLAAVLIPTHDYETHGEAVAGRNRRELQVGAAAGADLNRILPRTYVHGRYALATAERMHGFSSVRSQVDLEAGYDVSSRIGLRGLAAWQIRHKGPTIANLASDDWLGHDRFIVSSYFNLGGGMTLALTHNTELHALWIATVSGKSGAHRARMLAIGTSWSFGSLMGGFDAVGALKEESSRSIRPRAGF
jgi:hypothetical protein